MAAEQTLKSISENFALHAGNNFKTSIANDITDVYYFIQEAQNSITLAAQGREEAKKFDQVAELDDTFKQFVNLEKELDIQKNAFNLMKQRINMGEKITEPINYYENTKRTMREATRDDEVTINSNEKYLAFRQHIWNVNHPEEVMPTLNSSSNDDDIVMGPTKISLKCPLTRTWLEDPVTSIKCKHTYSKKAIYSLFPSYSHAIPCPIPGCNKTVAKVDLRDDTIMAERVSRAKEREEEPDTTEFFDL